MWTCTGDVMSQNTRVCSVRICTCRTHTQDTHVCAYIYTHERLHVRESIQVCVYTQEDLYTMHILRVCMYV